MTLQGGTKISLPTLWGTNCITPRCPRSRRVRHDDNPTTIRGDGTMKKSLLATVAAAALFAGTGLAMAQGAAKEQPGAQGGGAGEMKRGGDAKGGAEMKGGAENKGGGAEMKKSGDGKSK